MGNRGIARALALRVLQRVPATDDLRRVGDVDLAVARRQMRLQRSVDVFLGHGENYDLVVGQQVSLDGPGKGKAVELRPIGRRIVHGEHFRIVACRLRLRGFCVETRRGGHVEAFRCPNPLSVVNQHEGRGLVDGTLDARRPMGLIAKNNIERRCSVVLRTLHDAERMVGAKDHGYRVRAR